MGSDRAAIGWIGAGTLIVQLPFLNRGISLLDEGSLLAIARSLSDGEVLYRDRYTFVGPLAYEAMRLLIDGFGPGLLVGRIAQAFVFSFTAIVVYLVLREFAGVRWASLGTIACVPLKLIDGSLLPVPLLKLSPPVPASVSRPLLAFSVTSSGLAPASTSVTAIRLPLTTTVPLATGRLLARILTASSSPASSSMMAPSRNTISRSPARAVCALPAQASNAPGCSRSPTSLLPSWISSSRSGSRCSRRCSSRGWRRS